MLILESQMMFILTFVQILDMIMMGLRGMANVKKASMTRINSLQKQLRTEITNQNKLVAQALERAVKAGKPTKYRIEENDKSVSGDVTSANIGFIRSSLLSTNGGPGGGPIFMPSCPKPAGAIWCWRRGPGLCICILGPIY